MKKILIFGVIIFFSLCIYACGNEKIDRISEISEIKDIGKIGILYSWHDNSALVSNKNVINNIINIFNEMTLSPTTEQIDSKSMLLFIFHSDINNNFKVTNSIIVDEKGILIISGESYKITSEFKYKDLYLLYESNQHRSN